MKSYTDLEQSKKLAEFLPLESADAYYIVIDQRFFLEVKQGIEPSKEDIPCWSLAALLDVLNKTAYFIDEDANVTLSSYKTVEWHLGINNSDLELVTGTNPIDACVEMIVKLKEGRLL